VHASEDATLICHFVLFIQLFHCSIEYVLSSYFCKTEVPYAIMFLVFVANDCAFTWQKRDLH
jgi:hypothetical protein